MRGTRLRRFLGFGAVALCVGCALASPARALDRVDGISDQHLGAWVGSVAPTSALAAQFPSPLADAGTGAPVARIGLARYVVQWDVMSGGGYAREFANLQAWYDTAVALSLTPELALANYDCAGCLPPPSSESFSLQLQALHSRFPAISVYEAWNEPNLAGSFHISAALAASLMNATYSFCASRGCTAVAGDFSDADPGMAAYEREYEGHLDPPDPGNWAIHLYHAVKYETLDTLDSFLSLLPDRRSDRVWLTELGAYYCEFGQLRGAALQERNARFIVDSLIPVAAPVHAFYYQGAWPYDTSPPCAAGTQDTALYAAQSVGGPLLARPAAAVILGPEDPPSSLQGVSLALQPGGAYEG